MLPSWSVRFKKAAVEHKFITVCLKHLFVIAPKKICIGIGAFFAGLYKGIEKAISKSAIKSLAKKTPINPNKIIFITSQGKYDCNPKYICNEIIRQNLPYELVWTVRKMPTNGNEGFPRQLKLVKRDSYDFYKEVASAKIIVDNSISLEYMQYRKKPDQILIETWHGAIGIKAFGRGCNNDKEWLRKADKEASLTDYCISNSDFETNLFRTTFWQKAEILQYGHARNDILFKLDSVRVHNLDVRIRKKYKIKEGYKICLYAPTFRDDGDYLPYCIPYTELRAALSERFGGDWVVLTRYHQKLRHQLRWMKLPKKVINVDNWPDIQEIMAISDFALTDYSSWICEYLLTGRPGVLYVTDVESFEGKERTLLYPLTESPYPLTRNVNELVSAVLNFDMDKFNAKREWFFDKHGSVDDGLASRRAVNKIRELMGDKPIDIHAPSNDPLDEIYVPEIIEEETLDENQEAKENDNEVNEEEQL